MSTPHHSEGYRERLAASQLSEYDTDRVTFDVPSVDEPRVQHAKTIPANNMTLQPRVHDFE